MLGLMSRVVKDEELVRGIGLPGAISLNMINMIGVGPFVTLPLIVLAMHGPQAILGWVLGAVLAACDGLVWAELGAAMPKAGGSYEYLRTIYGPRRAGKISLVPVYLATELQRAAFDRIRMRGPGAICGLSLAGLAQSLFCVPAPYPDSVCAHVTAGHSAWAWDVGGDALLRGRRGIAVSQYTERSTILRPALGRGDGHDAGRDPHRAAALSRQPGLRLPPGAFQPSSGFFTGLGAALLIATYDYWGAYNICFLGAEVRDPGRTIPRAIVWSVALVAALYLLMNTSVLGTMPWQELIGQAGANARLSVAAVVVQRAYGALAGRMVALLVVWTAFASVYALLLGYSRVPYAAALDGNYFRIFARVHPRHRIPNVSLLMLAGVSMVFCMLQLVDLVAALVVIRILLQFLLQQVGVMVLRRTQPEMERPFRIWLYPLPPLVAIAGFLYILFSRPHFAREIFFAMVVVLTGTATYMLRAGNRRREWPFAATNANEPRSPL
jgi:APA family basic amino acid/polyamine antiporter